MDLKALNITPDKLPAIPRVAQEVIASFSRTDVKVDQIASLIEVDAVLSAKLLWLANSSYFHVSRSIGTVTHAIQILGFAMVRNLVLGNSVANAYRHTPAMDLPQFWRYNLYTACAARWLAVRCGTNADVAFMLGLLHALGELQMHAAAPAALAALDKQMSVLDPNRANLEVESFGICYSDVSAELARCWNFPDDLVNELRCTRRPLEGPEFFAPAACVHLAAWRTRAQAAGTPSADLLSTYPKEVALRLGLDTSWVCNSDCDGEPASGVTMPPFSELTHGLEKFFN
jgi:HD-like signal output (HDOD) protein